MYSPLLSIIVCTYNREKYIGQCLKLLANQTLDHSKYEVLVINNNSTDNTQNIVDDIIQKYSLTNFKSFIEENQGHTYARNRGISESFGKILSFLDDDAFVAVDYCEQLLSFFEKHKKVAAIGGKIVPEYEWEEPPWMSSYLLPLVAALDLGEKSKPFGSMKFPIGANMAFRKSVFENYGAFDIDLGRRGTGLEGGDEKEMFIRLKKGKEEIWYVPQVFANHVIPPQRVEISYIKGLAKGVGTSERKRLSKKGIKEIVLKIVSELSKSGATIILSITYILKGQYPKAKMLILFRYWVLSGYFTKYE
jgi:glycosyltransferase involved in cell wall biosynthesis